MATLFSCSFLAGHPDPGRFFGLSDPAEHRLAVADPGCRFVDSCVMYLEGLTAAAVFRCPWIDLLLYF